MAFDQTVISDARIRPCNLRKHVVTRCFCAAHNRSLNGVIRMRNERIHVLYVPPTTCMVCVSVIWHTVEPSDLTHSSTENVAVICDNIFTSSWPCCLVAITFHAGNYYECYYTAVIVENRATIPHYI